MKINLKIKSKENFRAGFAILIFSIIPFSYMNHSDKYKLENCFKVEGTIESLSKTYSGGSDAQDGWLIELDSLNYKIRIVGEYYNALDTNLFNQYVKKNNKLTFYILKEETNGVFEKLNSGLGIKDAATIRFNENEILSIENIKSKIKDLFIMNLSFGLIAVGLGIYYILKSFK